MGEASEDSVKVVGGRRVDLAEQSVCVSELVERRKRVKFDDFGSIVSSTTMQKMRYVQ